MSGDNEQGFKDKLEKQLLSGRNSAQKTSEYAPEDHVPSEPKRITKPQTEAQRKLADLLKSSVVSREKSPDTSIN